MNFQVEVINKTISFLIIQNLNFHFLIYSNMSANFEVKAKQNGRWRKEQHEKFLLGLQLYGKNWKKIEELIGTRSGAQIRSHAQKFFLKLNKNQHDSDHNQSTNHQIIQSSPKISKIQKSEKETSESFHSYFFQEIIKLNTQKIQQNFWSLFIDQKKQHGLTDNKFKAERKNSFITGEETQNIEFLESGDLKELQF